MNLPQPRKYLLHGHTNLCKNSLNKSIKFECIILIFYRDDLLIIISILVIVELVLSIKRIVQTLKAYIFYLNYKKICQQKGFNNINATTLV